MTASIVVPADYDLAQIATDTGFPNPSDRWYIEGRLFVRGPTQQALETALSTYALNHSNNIFQLKKQHAKLLVDEMAESVRLRYITTGLGQSMTYQEKVDEATDYVAAGYPQDLTPYPFIDAEVSATGLIAQIVADNILKKRTIWIKKSAKIEKERIKGKTNIDSATDKASLNNFYILAIEALTSL